MLIKKIITLLTALLMLAGTGLAQEITLNIQESPEMHIYGDSNIKKWDAAVNEVSGTLSLQNIEELGSAVLTPDNFAGASITVPVEQIESESGGLTKNIHKYLEADNHPNITFELVEITNIVQQDDSLIVSAQGVINAAGKDNPVEMVVNATIQDGSIQLSGEKELLMTDFDIDPPTAVFGTIRSRDEFVVRFNVTFSR